MSGKKGITVMKTPLSETNARKLRAGDTIELTGEIVTARDKVYSRVLGQLRARERPPLNLRGATIYHCGPLVKRTSKGWQVISAGPTTSARLDSMQAEFVKRTGARALIGKGGVGGDVARELSKLGCVYLAFPGGAGVLAAQSIKSVEHLHWQDLGLAEALWVLRVKDFGPLVVAIDTRGKNLYQRAPSPRQQSA